MLRKSAFFHGWWLQGCPPLLTKLYVYVIKSFTVTGFYITDSLQETLCSCVRPMDCSLPGSSVHGIFQARVLEWVGIALC